MPSTPETPPLDLATFLAARLDDDAAEGDCEGADEYESCRDQSARRELEVEAKRRILDEHSNVNDGSCGTCVEGQWGYPTHGGCLPANWPCPTLRLLAQTYAAHPDYREEWRP